VIVYLKIAVLKLFSFALKLKNFTNYKTIKPFFNTLVCPEQTVKANAVSPVFLTNCS
jgi:hypothetical protein